MALIWNALKEANTMPEIKRKKVEAIGFSKPTITADYRLIQPVDQPPYKPLKHRVNPMFRIKTTLVTIALKTAAKIPERQLWEFISYVLAGIEGKISKAPKWLQLFFFVLDEVLIAIHPNSPGGYAITKEEFKGMIDRAWLRLNHMIKKKQNESRTLR